jgi:hypothetical protein
MHLKGPGLLVVLILLVRQNSMAQTFQKNLPIREWLVSINPFGVLEPQSALGAGIGYRINKSYEIWMESSFLTRVSPGLYDHISGFRQILQGKYFFDPKGPFFVAAEARYKFFSLGDKGMFYNPVSHDTLSNVSYRSRHYFFGGALQFGGRFLLSSKGNLLVEIIAGFGVKQKTRVGDRSPAGYLYIPAPMPTDPNINYRMQQPGTTIYLPGSIRFIYVFGRSLK